MHTNKLVENCTHLVSSTKKLVTIINRYLFIYIFYNFIFIQQQSYNNMLLIIDIIILNVARLQRFWW